MITFTIIGALIGAGFASGQEIYVFFYRFGIKGLVGIFLCSIIMSVAIYRTLNLIYKNKINTYEEFLEKIFANKRISHLMNILVNIFLCITFFIMVSGFGAYFEQKFGLNKLIGSTILAVISYITFSKNIEFITKLNSIIVPILILSILMIGIKKILNTNLSETCLNTTIDNNYYWIIQSIIYTSYNLILIIPVLVSLRQFIKTERQIKQISILVCIIIFILASLIFLLLINVDINFNNLQMPIIYVIEKDFSNFSNLYGIIILIAIFTTAISSGISFLKNICKKENSFPQIMRIMCITSVIISQFGFSNLVKILFSVFGYLGLMQVFYILKAKS